MFFICLASRVVKQLLNFLNLQSQSFFYLACWIISNVHLNYRNKTPKENPNVLTWEPVAIWFVVYGFKQGPISIAYRSSAELLLHFQTDLVDVFCQQYPCSLYNFSIWKLYHCGWYIILQVDFCLIEYTECFFIFLFHLNRFPFEPSVGQEGYSPPAVSALYVSRRCLRCPWAISYHNLSSIQLKIFRAKYTV